MIYNVFVVFELVSAILLLQQERAAYLKYLLANLFEVKD